jgi:nitrogen regulatory protein P-II 1
MTFVECEGTGQYSDQEKQHLSYKYPFVNAYKVVKLEILISDEHVSKIIDIIRKNGRTGYRGDGMILVSEVDEVYKVRTDEEGVHSI